MELAEEEARMMELQAEAAGVSYSKASSSGVVKPLEKLLQQDGEGDKGEEEEEEEEDASKGSFFFFFSRCVVFLFIFFFTSSPSRSSQETAPRKEAAKGQG